MQTAISVERQIQDAVSQWLMSGILLPSVEQSFVTRSDYLLPTGGRVNRTAAGYGSQGNSVNYRQFSCQFTSPHCQSSPHTQR